MRWTGSSKVAAALAAATAAALLPLASGSPASASFPGENGGFVFYAGTPRGDWAIGTCGPHAQNVHLAVRSGTEEVYLGEPKWSPSGEWVVYVDPALYKRTYDVVVMSADGKVSRVIHRSHHRIYDPTWSPGGRRIAFVGAGELRTVRRDGTHLTRLTRTPHRWEFEPSWSTRNQIAFGVNDHQPGGAHLYVVRPDGRHQTQLTFGRHGDWSPDWAPNGRRLVYLHDYRLWTMRGDGSHQAPVGATPPAATSPVWAPDGTRIAYLTPGLHTIAPDGTRHRRLNTPGGLYLQSIDWRPR